MGRHQRLTQWPSQRRENAGNRREIGDFSAASAQAAPLSAAPVRGTHHLDRRVGRRPKPLRRHEIGIPCFAPGHGDQHETGSPRVILNAVSRPMGALTTGVVLAILLTGALWIFQRRLIYFPFGDVPAPSERRAGGRRIRGVSHDGRPPAARLAGAAARAACRRHHPRLQRQRRASRVPRDPGRGAARSRIRCPALRLPGLRRESRHADRGRVWPRMRARRGLSSSPGPRSRPRGSCTSGNPSAPASPRGSPRNTGRPRWCCARRSPR